MAYGLDFQEIYYADHNRIDIGVLETYEIDIDLAKDKDFRIISPEPVIPISGYWYIQGTEYGGIVDTFKTSSDDKEIEYRGRTFRGILNSHHVDVEGMEQTIPSQSIAHVNQEGATSEGGSEIDATITECLRELISGFGDLFVVDEPDTNEAVNVLVPDYTVLAGTTVYDAMVGLCRSIDFTFVLEYRSDHKIHVVPILIQDYTDYLKGSKYDGLGFQTEITTNVVNHLISTARNEETGELYRIHFFTDENGGIQPYAVVDNPMKDSQYILDKRNQVMLGVDEISEYVESSVSTVESYELLSSVPSDWRTNFGSYFKHEYDDEGIESWDPYEAVGNEVYTHLTKKPSDWRTNYSEYFIRSFDETTGGWKYTAVSAESVLDMTSITKITKKPSDWKSNSEDYYYKFQTGTGIEYRPYEDKSKEKYVRMTKKPSDWNTNFSSYYRKVYEKEVIESGKKKKKLIDTVKHKGAKYVNCKKDDDKKNGKIPSFSKRAHYRRDTYTKPPTFKKNNCYRIKKKEVTPEWNTTDNYYCSMKMEYSPPNFVIGEAYKKVFDHYAEMIEDAIAFFEDEQKKSSQTMELEDFVVNIGDIVGGTDEFTGTNVVGNITNIEAKIENGLIDVAYSVTVEDYTTHININRQAEDGGEEE